MNYDELRAIIERAGVHPLLGPEGAGYGIEQNPHELATFLAALPDDIHTVLEIGTGHKAGLARFMREVMMWRVTCVDRNAPVNLPIGVRFFCANSADAVELVRGEYDLVIIDASHDYESASRDYANYAPMGRIVMLHDIAGLRDCEGVEKFWNEIAYKKAGTLKKGYYEVKDKGPQRAGIGWVVK